jgi:hypothetical protein
MSMSRILAVDVGHRALQHVGAVPKIVCQRTAVPGSFVPVKLGSANCVPDGKRFVIEAETDIAGKERTRRGYVLLGGHEISLLPWF